MNNNDSNKQPMNINNDQNNSPVDDFDGLSANQMKQLIYAPFDDNNLIKFAPKAKNGIFNGSPAFLIAMELLTLLSEGQGIKLTSKGYLPLKLVKSLYEKGYSLDEQIEQGEVEFRSEYDWLLLSVVKQLLLVSEIAEVKDKVMSLTQKGKEMLAQKSDYFIYIELLQAFCLGFSWASNDGFESAEIGQAGFMYVLYLLKKYGGSPREAAFYGEKYFRAFPMLFVADDEDDDLDDDDLDDDDLDDDDSDDDDLDDEDSDMEDNLDDASLLDDGPDPDEDSDTDDESRREEDRLYCFDLRFFTRFCQWFDLAVVEEDFGIMGGEFSFEMFERVGEVKRSKLFEKIII